MTSNSPPTPVPAALADSHGAARTDSLRPRSVAEAAWYDGDSPPRARGMPQLHLAGYDGPLDVLLDLAERQRIDLGRIAILDLVEQFVAAMERLAQPDAGTRVAIERRAEWLILATQLLLLRSRLLFPASARAAEAAARDAATALQRLGDIRFLRAAAAWLERQPQLGRDTFPRPHRGPDPRVGSYMALLEACLVALQGSEGDPALPDPVYAPVRAQVFSLQAALARLRARLPMLTEATPLQAFLPRLPEHAPDRALLARSALSSTFLAALELARTAEAVLHQDQPLGTIMVEARGHGPNQGPNSRVS